MPSNVHPIGVHDTQIVGEQLFQRRLQLFGVAMHLCERVRLVLISTDNVVDSE